MLELAGHGTHDVVPGGQSLQSNGRPSDVQTDAHVSQHQLQRPSPVAKHLDHRYDSLCSSSALPPPAAVAPARLMSRI
jgi:hypothetical protein